MKIKMTEYVQGNSISGVLVKSGEPVNILAPDEVYEVNENLGAWILEHRKGVLAEGKVSPAVEVVAQIVESPEVSTETLSEDEPIMTSRKFGKRGAK